MIKRFVLRRLAFLIPQLFIVSILAFTLIKLSPGDVATLVLGPLHDVSAERRVREELGLDKSVFTQYAKYVERTVQLDFGTSFRTKQDVVDELGRKVPATLWLITLALVVCLVVGIGVGYLAALAPPGGFLNRGIIGYGFLAGALPDFWVGLILIFFLFTKLDILPVPSGQLPLGVDQPDRVTSVVILDCLLDGDFNKAGVAFRSTIMPLLTLVLVYAPVVLKITAVTTAEVFHSQYVIGARAVGVRQRTIVRYIMRNALLPIITTSGVLYAFLLGGAVLVETVFSWGGFGQYAVDAVTNKDFNVIQTFLLVAAVFTIFVYLAVDLLHFAVDPRIRAGVSGK